MSKSLGSARAAQLGLGVFVAGLGWLFTLSIDADSGLGAKILTYGMTGFFGLIAAMLFYVGVVKSSPSQSPLIRALRERPDDVVWIFEQKIEVQVGPIEAPVTDTNIITRLADGSTVAITVGKQKAQALLHALQVLAPRAAVGFSPELEAQFKANPRSIASA